MITIGDWKVMKLAISEPIIPKAELRQSPEPDWARRRGAAYNARRRKDRRGARCAETKSCAISAQTPKSEKCQDDGHDGAERFGNHAPDRVLAEVHPPREQRIGDIAAKLERNEKTHDVQQVGCLWCAQTMLQRSPPRRRDRAAIRQRNRQDWPRRPSGPSPSPPRAG